MTPVKALSETPLVAWRYPTKRKGKMKDGDWTKFTIWVEVLLVPFCKWMIDPECLEVEDSEFIPDRLSDLFSMKNTDARDPLKVLLQESPKRARDFFSTVAVAPDQYQRLEQPVRQGVETSKAAMKVSQWRAAMERVADELIPRFYELYAAGRSDVEARERVASAIRYLNPLVMPGRMGPVTAFERLLPEIITDDLFESYFNYRRAGVTIRTESRAAAKRQRRAQERSERPTTEPSAPLSSRGASYEKLGMDTAQVVWKRGRGKRQGQAVKPMPSIPVFQAAHSATRSEPDFIVGNRLERFTVREYRDRLFEVVWEVRSEAEGWFHWDFIAVNGSKDLNRTRLKALLHGTLGENEWPEVLRRAEDPPGAMIHRDPREEARSFLDSVVNLDDGAMTPWVHL